MRLTSLWLVAAGMFMVSAAAPASARQNATMSVGARVAPLCRINVDPAPADGRGPGVRVQCGRSGLRALRVTTDRGDGLQPITTFAGNQLRAGGEVMFVVAQPLATVASLLPVFAMPPAPEHRPVTVTLDF